jgi:hypothetical protein
MPDRFPLPAGTFKNLENLTSDDGLLAFINLLAEGILGGVPSGAVLWVGKHGDDNNPGTTLERAFLTFTAAVAAASSGDVILCLDGGTYVENLTVPAGIDIYAPAALLAGAGTGAATDGALVVNEGFYRFGAIAAQGSESAVVKADYDGIATVHANFVTLPIGSGVGFYNRCLTQPGVLVAGADRISVGQGCTGISSDTPSGAIEATIQNIDLIGNSAVGISQSNVAGTMIIHVCRISEKGSFSTTTAISLTNGRMDAMISVVSADTAWNIAASATLSIFYNQATGTMTETGTVLKSTPV